MPKPAQVALQVLALGALGLVAGAAHSWYAPVHLRLQQPVVNMSGTPSPVTPPPKADTVPPATLGLHITLAQAKTLFDQGVTFIDARTDREYVLGTIPGSRHITPVSFSRPETSEVLRFLDPNQPLVVFCGGGDCHDSENLVILLQQSGYTALHIMTDGFPAWQAAGYEVQTPAPDPGSGQ